MASTEQSRLLPQGNTLSLLFEKPSKEPPAQPPRDSRNGSSLSPQETGIHRTKKEYTTSPPPACPAGDFQSTFVGSFVFLLYQVVFCLAQAATITRPHANHSSTGVMAQLAALGIFTAGPLFLFELSDDVPAIYPASDLFLAPFLAGLAQSIDRVLWQHGLQDDDKLFLGTFGMLLTVGFLLSGGLCILAATFKLANLGAFLPHSVLCGFFTTIGILIWTLGFSVDVGQKVGQVVTSGNWTVIRHAIIHHTPSVCGGVIMHVLGPKNPLYVILLVGCTVVGSYLLLAITGTSLGQAQDQNWFFSAEDLVPHYPTLSLKEYSLPAPFGIWVSLWRGEVYWEAFSAGMPMMMALIVLYLVRCSLHSAALKKNIPLVTRKYQPTRDLDESIGTSVRSRRRGVGRIQKGPLTLGFILEHGYGYSQLLSGLVGGIAVAPAVAASLTLFKLRAETAPPQYGSCLLVILFYFSNFSLVQYIPKPAFSSLMVLAGLDMIRRWIFDSFFKTKAKIEWCVGPLLVVLSFAIGVLKAIFVGVAISTFIFAANFYAAGAVKFVGSGLTLRSAVERGAREGEWLDQHGDWIQILVVQNFLFFGNSQSVLTYILTMFEDEDSVIHPTIPLPPKPKYLILDFSLVSGMDTSAVDIIREIVELTSETNRCRLYLSGLKPSLKSILLYAGLKAHGSHRRWMYTSDMETALAKAEDALLSTEFDLEEQNQNESRQRNNSLDPSDGFLYALKKLDEIHGLTTAKDLADLAPWIKPMELRPGDVLLREAAPGLHFVETGLLRFQWSVGSTTRHFDHPGYDLISSSTNLDTIGHSNARSESVGREMAYWKEQHQKQALHHATNDQQSFRLARVGQGWIIGTIEVTNNVKRPGVHVAISACRLHHLPEVAIQKLQAAENP